MKYSFLITLLFQFLWCDSYSQTKNLVKNGGFERLIGGDPCWYGQLEKATYWESDSHCDNPSGYFYHSPDFYHGPTNFDASCSTCASNTTGLPGINFANRGHGYVGFGRAELLQQKLSAPLEHLKHYTFSAYIRTEDWLSGFKLKISMAKKKISYKEKKDRCDPEYDQYMEGVSQKIVTIFHEDLDLNVYPGGSWVRLTTSFVATREHEGLDWVGIDITPDASCPSTGNTASLYIDDVILKEDAHCAPSCDPQLGSIRYTTLGNGLELGNFDNVWKTNISNATGVYFSIANRWGETNIFEKTAIDVNGLKNINENDFQMAWEGRGSDGEYLAPYHTYVYTLKIWNCSEEVVHQGGITIDDCQIGSLCTNFTLSTPPKNLSVDDCIDHFRIIQNEVYTGYADEIGDQVITMGENVAWWLSPGPVILESGSDVYFNTTSSSGVIEFKPGFEAKNGSEMLANISLNTSNRSKERTASDYSSRKLTSREKGLTGKPFNFAEDKIKLYPELSDGTVFLDLKFSERHPNVQLDLYSISGRRVLSKRYEDVLANKYKLDLSNQQNGIYTVKLQTMNKLVTKKLVINK